MKPTQRPKNSRYTLGSITALPTGLFQACHTHCDVCSVQGVGGLATRHPCLGHQLRSDHFCACDAVVGAAKTEVRSQEFCQGGSEWPSPGYCQEKRGEVGSMRNCRRRPRRMSFSWHVQLGQQDLIRQTRRYSLNLSPKSKTKSCSLRSNHLDPMNISLPV